MKKYKHTQFWWMFPIFIILAVMLACGESTNTGKKVGEVEATNISGPTEVISEPSEKPNVEKATDTVSPKDTPLPTKEVYEVGDVIELDDQLVAMYGAEFKGDLLIAKFIIANPGSEEISVSSLLSFSAKNPDGTLLDEEIFDCGGSLDGKVPPGDKLKGQICWKGAQPGAKVYYEASLFDSGATVWQIPETVADKEIVFPGLVDTTITQEVFKVGDLIDANGHLIVLTGAEYKGDKLVASFLIGNNGAEELHISSMVSFTARKPSGENLQQDFMDCDPSLDGIVVPGDILQGQICWNGAELGSKVYYDANLFGSGMIVWDIPESIPPTDIEYPEISSLSIQQPTYKVGDIIELKDHSITLNSLTLKGKILMANFTIENTGTEDVQVSSIASFSARNPDGTPLSSSLFDCGTSLDGKVIPGDKLKGDVCWEGALPEARVYYDASLFESGVVIWISD
jgi:hypothetical protein